MIFAVLDTNVIVAALLSRHADAATVRVLNAVAEGIVVPLYNGEILAEYREVLSRPRFKFDAVHVSEVVRTIASFGLEVNGVRYNQPLPDEKDRVFLEVALAGQTDDAKMVTGNLRHFPSMPFVLSPARLCELIDTHGTENKGFRKDEREAARRQRGR